MSFKILIDNNINPTINFLTEHGLSIYFEFSGKKFLIDTGQTSKFIVNAEKLHVNLQEIDILFISHGHFDHIGGLEAFLKCNTKALIVISGKVQKQDYYSYRIGSKREIGSDLSFINSYIGRFVFVENNVEILPGMFILTNILQDNPTPKANTTLYKMENFLEVPDDFNHEMVVCTLKGNDITVFTGCAHKGISNILLSVNNKFKNKEIRTVIGGFHLVDSDDKNQFETDEDISSIAYDLLKHYPDTLFYTGHCTGKLSFERLKGILQNQINLFYSGYELENECIQLQ